MMKLVSVTLTSLLTVLTSVALGADGTLFERYPRMERPIALKEVTYNLSGITYNPDTHSYFVIQNNTGLMYEYDTRFTRLLRKIQLINLEDDDTEDLVYLGSGQFALANESNQVSIFTLRPGQTVVDLAPALPEVQVLQLPKARKDNKGIEGLCAVGDQFFAVQEMKPKRVYRFERPRGSSDFKNPRDFGVREAFNTEAIMKHRLSDLSGCYVEPVSGHLLVLSHESSRVMEITPMGRVKGLMNLPRFPEQYEGVTMGPQGEIVLVSEPNLVVVLPRR